MMEFDDYLRCGMLFFLGYVNRRMSKNPDYLPNSLVRAVNAALKAADSVEIDKTAMGVAFDGEKDKPTGGYVVIVRKLKSRVDILEINDIVNDSKIEPTTVLAIFNIQIELDKFETERISIFDAVNILNKCFENPKFLALGERWPEARDKFISDFNQGKIHLPEGIKLEYVAMLKGITKETKWEDYPPKLRSSMAQSILGGDPSAAGTMVFSTTHDHTVEKYFVFRMVNKVVMDFARQYMPPKFR